MRRACLIALLALGCEADGALEFSGRTMGTHYRVTLVESAGRSGEDLRAEVEAVLERVDARMSTYRLESELSRFNAARTDAWFAISAETGAVVAEALRIHRLTGGAYDPTVGPLIAIWGFGAAGVRSLPPTPAALGAARERVGAEALQVRGDGLAVRKTRPDLELDLSGIAKGHSVDAVARRLEALGHSRYLVDVGGELRAHGASPRGTPWRVALEQPRAGATGWQRVVALTDTALATSGTYRNTRAVEGRVRPHIVDPRTGEPVAHALVSVSVLAPTAARADALATGLLVLGPDAGPTLAKRRGWPVLFVSERNGGLVEQFTGGFRERVIW